MSNLISFLAQFITSYWSCFLIFLHFKEYDVCLITVYVILLISDLFSSAILVLYLTQELYYDSDTATIIFHSSTMALFICSLFGAVIADSWFGKFKTIFWLLIVYAIGISIIAIGSFKVWNLPAKELTMIGLALYALGSGGVKPCLTAFGGEQFQLPEQSTQLNKFFSIMFFVGSFGSIVSAVVTPLLRRTECFDSDQCFVAAYGLPAAFMCFSILVFLLGLSSYRFVSSPENKIVKILKCIGVGWSKKKSLIKDN